MTSSILACLKRDLSSLWLQFVLKILSRCWQLCGCDTTYIALSSSKRQDQFHADPANYICTMWSLSSCCCSLDDLSLQPSQGLQAELVSFTRANWGNNAKKVVLELQQQRFVLSLSNGKQKFQRAHVTVQRWAIACHLIIIRLIFFRASSGYFP